MMNERRHLRGLIPTALLLAVCGTLAPSHVSASDGEKPREVLLWHSYRTAEEEALRRVLDDFEKEHPDIKVRTLGIPYDAFASRLTAAIPRGRGPDLFIFAHERVGSWASRGVVVPFDDGVHAPDLEGYFPETVDALTYEGHLYGLPLAFKSIALFYNRDLVDEPPATTDEMVALAGKLSDPSAGRYGLAYPADDFFFHSAWLFGFGGKLFDADTPVLDTDGARMSLEFLRNLVLRERVVPQEPTPALVTRLFNEGAAAMVVNGPWFIGEIEDDIDWAISLLPKVSETGLRATPFLTVEGVMIAARAREPDAARSLARYIAEDGAVTRAVVGRQSVAWSPAYENPRVGDDPVLQAFLDQLPHTVPTDNRPAMQAVWEPARGALGDVMRGGEPDVALARAQSRLEGAVRDAPAQRSLAPYLLVFGLLCFAGVGAWAYRSVRSTAATGGLMAEARRSRTAYAYLAPAFAGLLFLVLVPFAVAVGIAFTHHEGGEFYFVGLANFRDILFGESYGVTDPLSFYFTLLVTILWTVANVALHVTIGLMLALLLKEPWLRMKGVYRALLIIPWAVPNYITALIWKGMFHKQFGAINGVLTSLGLEPVSWFGSFWTAFTANLVTNTWLGFPFMMVVALGALQSIPSDLYEAADVDGAGRLQKFFRITLPLLKPAMLPAVLLGMIWTFNMFNIIYLVSGGEPGGSTDILISEAYRWAFERQEQYGYAAAYAVLIFCILVGYTLSTRRVTGGEERS